MTITVFTITPDQIRGDQLADEILQATGIDVLDRYTFYPPDEVRIAGDDVAAAEAEIQAVIDAHVPDPLYFPEDVGRARQEQAEQEIRDIPGWATWTLAEMLDWFDANITVTGPERAMFRNMVIMHHATRNKLWSHLEGS